MTTLIGLEVTGRAVLVAGGGPVAARRAAAVAADGALVTVVAPHLCEELVDLVAADRVTWHDREVLESDVDGAWLVHAATDDAATNAAVCRWASERRVWSVCASAVEVGSARTPAVVDHAGLSVGVVSHGAPDPARTRAVRDRLAEVVRLEAVDLRSRRPRAGDRGRVVLVGGGPGAADLLTIRGRRALGEADVVVADRLGPRSVLDELPPDVEVVDVGKVPGRHAVTQEDINHILVDHASRGRVVVRLKGGDPFLFGRGAEEQQALAAHGIPVEVVPGISSALSAPAVAGIPVTHRGCAPAVHVAHGHGDLSAAAVATVVDCSATLVLLMGVSRLAHHVDTLVAAGADPGTPVAVVEDATMPSQRTTRATLATVVDAAAAAGVRAPAVVVVGDVAAEGLLEPVP